ncbi:hypothetical protein TNCT_73191 [Trichonephila clavata]|uniref:Uncharacterized protein n=1 Tax=Trichonephila clavata TaxID=2740835 RepID=A0A8X6G0L7_TRICU|nr:hypothetical protein TNCT_73191 [Trichonephila clavata]
MNPCLRFITQSPLSHLVIHLSLSRAGSFKGIDKLRSSWKKEETFLSIEVCNERSSMCLHLRLVNPSVLALATDAKFVQTIWQNRL